MVEEELFEKHYRKIKKLLDCANTAPYYKGLIEEAGIDLTGEVTYQDFARIRKTNKDIYEQNKFKMITEKVKGFDYEEFNQIRDLSERYNYLLDQGLVMKLTSGSTGQPLEVIKSNRDNFRDYVSLNENRKRMTAYDLSGTFVQIWPVNKSILKKYYSEQEAAKDYKVINDRGYMYFLSEHSEENLKKMYDFMFEKNCEWITSSPTVLYKFAKMIDDQKLQLPNIRYLECHSEKLYDWQREMIEKVFKCDISSIYSSNEVQFIGGLCKNGKMHLFEKSCFVEIVPDENGNKEILLTSLNYFDIPIIRYKIGDCGEWDMSGDCGCEFNDYAAFEVYGFRKNDFIKTERGVVEPFLITDSVFALARECDIAINRYRAVQNAFNKFTYYIPGELIGTKADIIKKYLEKFVGDSLDRDDIEVKLEEFNLEDTTHFSKKFRYFVTEVE